MAKNQNTFAKRLREMEKKRKADEKRVRRTNKKEGGAESSESTDSQTSLSAAEQDVLSAFRKYLMTPGKMLCFGAPEMETLSAPLAKLIDRGMLVSEDSPGGYSLTRSGFDAMNDRA
jgi:hypothetical protein